MGELGKPKQKFSETFSAATALKERFPPMTDLDPKHVGREAAAPTEAIDQLRNYQEQLDMDGIMVGVSRQAVDEVLAYIDALARMGGAEGREQIAPALVRLWFFRDLTDEQRHKLFRLARLIDEGDRLPQPQQSKALDHVLYRSAAPAPDGVPHLKPEMLADIQQCLELFEEDVTNGTEPNHWVGIGIIFQWYLRQLAAAPSQPAGEK